MQGEDERKRYERGRRGRRLHSFLIVSTDREPERDTPRTSDIGKWVFRLAERKPGSRLTFFFLSGQNFPT